MKVAMTSILDTFTKEDYIMIFKKWLKMHSIRIQPGNPTLNNYKVLCCSDLNQRSSEKILKNY